MPLTTRLCSIAAYFFVYVGVVACGDKAPSDGTGVSKPLDREYFEPGVLNAIQRQWYPLVLSALDEPSFIDPSIPARAIAMRVLFLPALAPAVVVRFVQEQDHCTVVTTIRARDEIAWGPPDSIGLSHPVGATRGAQLRRDTAMVALPACRELVLEIAKTAHELPFVQVRRPVFDGGSWLFEWRDETGHHAFDSTWGDSTVDARVNRAGTAALKLGGAGPGRF